MDALNLFRLIFLAAIWGSSFLFMHNVASSLGPVLTAASRIGIAGFVLVAWYKIQGKNLNLAKNFKHTILIGFLNSALPFSFYSYASLHLPTSFEVILNSTSPLFAVLLESFFMKEKLCIKKIASLVLGILGVYFLVSSKPHSNYELDFHFTLSILACLGAAALYAISGIYIKVFSRSSDPSTLAGTTQLLAFFVLIPFSYFSPATAPVNSKIIFNMLMLSLVCSAIAYVLYFKLIQEVGPTKALSVTYLMPIFGILWGSLFLGEKINLEMMVGVTLILAGVFFSFKRSQN
jgi:drug/metabolite transporter (DMT)-like permease